MVQGRDYRLPKVPDNNGFPQRTRVRQRNRESLDLDDVMNGSDDDQESLPPPRGNQTVRSPPSTPRRAAPHAVSASTRELMDFLAEGPPEPKLSKSGKELVDFLAEGPPDYGTSVQSLETTKSKGTGRLQRMISKLNLGNGEKTKAVPDSPKTPHTKQAPSVYAPVRPVITSKTSQGTLSSLANRPIPPPAEEERTPAAPVRPKDALCCGDLFDGARVSFFPTAADADATPKFVPGLMLEEAIPRGGDRGRGQGYLGGSMRRRLDGKSRWRSVEARAAGARWGVGVEEVLPTPAATVVVGTVALFPACIPSLLVLLPAPLPELSRLRSASTLFLSSPSKSKSRSKLGALLLPSFPNPWVPALALALTLSKLLLVAPPACALPPQLPRTGRLVLSLPPLLSLSNITHTACPTRNPPTPTRIPRRSRRARCGMYRASRPDGRARPARGGGGDDTIRIAFIVVDP
ncbi:hypothetical protein NLJ89_g11671 [Agrocybe chaxingu]|uniref:Uncharacterized protein n=1 Tax=Agrocybe chaxingu TaxID=84603 RepID=A0A9W8JNS0_9AGAR|nr:hypothetical protein NLJ89_g11671 [Agrocybe chaxingu]